MSHAGSARKRPEARCCGEARVGAHLRCAPGGGAVGLLAEYELLLHGGLAARVQQPERLGLEHLLRGSGSRGD